MLYNCSKRVNDQQQPWLGWLYQQHWWGHARPVPGKSLAFPVVIRALLALAFGPVHVVVYLVWSIVCATWWPNSLVASIVCATWWPNSLVASIVCATWWPNSLVASVVCATWWPNSLAVLAQSGVREGRMNWGALCSIVYNPGPA